MVVHVFKMYIYPDIMDKRLCFDQTTKTFSTIRMTPEYTSQRAMINNAFREQRRSVHGPTVEMNRNDINDAGTLPFRSEMSGGQKQCFVGIDWPSDMHAAVHREIG